ncbi:response regulator transcription factor [Secundilactobacillus muriivasis]
MKTILIIEDNDDMQQLLSGFLAPTFNLVQAYSGTEGLLQFNANHVDLVLLDRLLPGKSGDDVLEIIRQTSQVPIIILTALDDTNDIAKLLLAGANDYVTKPFNINELQARIAVQLRQSQPVASTAPLTYKRLTLMPDQFTVTNGTDSCSLKRKECELLALLFENSTTIFTREQLYERIWQTPYLGDENTINVHLSNLRRKLHQLDPDHDYIETIWGIGVRLA